VNGIAESHAVGDELAIDEDRHMPSQAVLLVEHGGATLLAAELGGARAAPTASAASSTVAPAANFGRWLVKWTVDMTRPSIPRREPFDQQR